jgi:hypothetical protein
LKKYNLINIKTINDNVIENKKYFTFINDNVSISNINTNVTTNTFTNNNTFSAGPETPEIFENRKTNRELLINSKRNYKGPSIRELLMVNTDSDKNKNKTINKNKKWTKSKLVKQVYLVTFPQYSSKKFSNKNNPRKKILQ